jgi:uncharacterized membrane protein YagU involved in acid resistance
MNWPSSLLAGFVGTLLITTLEAGAQQLHLTRMSIPYLLGAAFTPNRDRAKVVGFFVHLVNGQLLALLYVAIFDAIGEVSILRGAMLGLGHSAVVLLVVMPLLPALHPRIASLEQGPTGMKLIEPPGPLALHYGPSTPLMVIVAHVIFGMVIGALYHFNPALH